MYIQIVLDGEEDEGGIGGDRQGEKERKGHKERRRELFRGRRGWRVRVEGDGGSID